MTGHEGTRREDVEPCGTPAAYRRHLRHGEPLDVLCRNAEARRYGKSAEARNAVKRDRWAALRAAGYSSPEAQRIYTSGKATAEALAARRDGIREAA